MSTFWSAAARVLQVSMIAIIAFLSWAVWREEMGAKEAALCIVALLASFFELLRRLKSIDKKQ